MKRNLRTMAISLALLVSSSIISSEEAIKCDTEDQVTHEMCSFMFSDEMYSVKVLASLIDGRMKSTLMSSEMIKFINDAGKARNAGMSAPIYPPPTKKWLHRGPLYWGEPLLPRAQYFYGDDDDSSSDEFISLLSEEQAAILYSLVKLYNTKMSERERSMLASGIWIPHEIWDIEWKERLRIAKMGIE